MSLHINMKATGENIRKKIDSVGVSPEELSKILDLDISTLYYWFQGKTLPKWESAVNIADMCHCRLDDLIVLEQEDEDEQG